MKQERLRNFWNVSQNVGGILKTQIHVAGSCKVRFARAENEELVAKAYNRGQSYVAKEAKVLRGPENQAVSKLYYCCRCPQTIGGTSLNAAD